VEGDVQVNGFHHVQVLIPEGGEERARAFYGGLLGLVEIDKPEALSARGGCWFVGAEVTLHLGVERPFTPATKAHVAIGVADLDAARAELEAAGQAIIDDGLDVGFRRFYTQDPFGNRLELVERPTSLGSSPPLAVRDEFEISDQPGRVDLAWLVPALSERAYWALGRPAETIVRSIESSLCFSIYTRGRQVGFARVVTDQATFAWLCDVFIDEAFRGHGLGAWLVEAIVADPRLTGLRRFLLATRDASELYRRHGGFGPLSNPDRWMARVGD
jgi:catechol 2,3-dioxygenase-like lactoylglutathione lyase family enzyme/GNAT superfamily N-acetyltransferase